MIKIGNTAVDVIRCPFLNAEEAIDLLGILLAEDVVNDLEFNTDTAFGGSLYLVDLSDDLTCIPGLPDLTKPNNQLDFYFGNKANKVNLGGNCTNNAGGNIYIFPKRLIEVFPTIYRKL